MKKLGLALSFLFLSSLSFIALSEDRPEAEVEVIEDLVEYCKDVADDEGTGKLSLSEFLLQCVNVELDLEGYQPIKKLPE